MKAKSIGMVVLVLCMVLGLSVSAHAFSNLVAYGDSLSDNGNIAKMTDGDVWVETLAGELGATLINNAYAGATTGMDNPAAAKVNPAFTGILGLQWQMETFQPVLAGALDLNDTLFTVLAGANDFFQQRDFAQAASNVGVAVEAIATSGAQDILVANLPNLGNAPAFYNDAAGPGTAALAAGWTSGFNLTLDGVLGDLALSHQGVNFYMLDLYDIFIDLIETDADGNITNLDTLFWDPVHPTSIGHGAVAQEALRLVSPVPEPMSLGVLLIGLAGMAVLGRRRRLH